MRSYQQKGFEEMLTKFSVSKIVKTRSLRSQWQVQKGSSKMNARFEVLKQYICPR
jgi:hypothetical protein